MKTRTTFRQAARRSLSRVNWKRIALWLGPTLLTVVMFVAFIFIARGSVDSLVAPSQDHVEGLELKTLIRQVKAELQEADLEALNNNEEPLFELQEFDLDLNFVAKGTTGGKVELSAVGSSVEVSRERLQHIHLRWKANPEARAVATQQASISAAPTDIINADNEQ